MEIDRSTVKILIADDTPKNIQILGSFLIEEDYQVLVAENGVEVLEILKSSSVDLILLDIMMPEMGGYECCQKIKENPLWANIPIIFLSAKNELEGIVKGLDYGAVDYVTKPFNKAELMRRIETHVQLKFAMDHFQLVSGQRKELLHLLCHDLVNPLSRSIAWTELLEDDAEDILEEAIVQIKMGHKNCMEIIRLVRQLLALEEGKLVLELDEFSLNDLVKDSYESLAKRFRDKRIEYKIDIPDRINIKAEKTSFLHSVYNNLITNALKFSNEGEAIEVKGNVNGDGKVEISIRDHGIGMPEDLAASIFDPHKPTSRKGTKGEKGTGFGMPLVKKFMEAYGGVILVHSKEKTEESTDHGTEIVLILEGDKAT